MYEKIIETDVIDKDFSLKKIIDDHFIVTEDFIYDKMCVRPKSWLEGIQFHEDKSKSDNDLTYGLLQVMWESHYDNFDIWYIVQASRVCGVYTTMLELVE